MKSFSFEAIGTHWSIDLYDPLPDVDSKSLNHQLRQRVSVFDSAFSRFRNDSLVSRMATSSGIYKLSEEGMMMLKLYRRLYELTDGRFTPLIGRTLEEAGYDALYTLKEGTLNHPPRWEDVLRLTDDFLEIKKPVLLDFGAIGKGLLIDQIAAFFKRIGCYVFCIDASGDILYRNTNGIPLRVGLEHPEHRDKVIGTTELLNESIAASAGNRRKWGNMHHLLDPVTLKPANTILASWIIADSAMLADALATAVFFCDPEKLKNTFRFSYAIVYPDYSIRKSDDFPGELYYTFKSSK